MFLASELRPINRLAVTAGRGVLALKKNPTSKICLAPDLAELEKRRQEATIRDPSPDSSARVRRTHYSDSEFKIQEQA
jgi:hypothetical protein